MIVEKLLVMAVLLDLAAKNSRAAADKINELWADVVRLEAEVERLSSSLSSLTQDRSLPVRMDDLYPNERTTYS
jgi:outer membrane murein-binding lipoprotein Lpp